MRSIFYKNRFRLLVFLSGVVIAFDVRAEGTKQLKPDTTYICDLYVQDGGQYSCFATENCPPDQKLYVRVANGSEKVYLGFGNDLTFRIKKNGVIVFGPVTISPSSTSGFIKYYKQAIAGPKILSSQGYNALVFYPDSPGDYSIEFNPAPISIFDITVIDTAIVPLAAIDGRLWSKDWGFNTFIIDYIKSALLATQYIYTDDSVVTSVYYNQMRGNIFDVTSTSNGCYPPPMPFDSSCLSRPGNHHYTQYKIFLNDPDSNQFPTGTLGSIITSTINVDPQCDGSFVVSFWVNKPGKVEIDVEVNPAPGHQPEDVVLMDTVSTGFNTILWNGLDGLGNPVPDGTLLTFSIRYINGLTNLALYDVERHLYGFIIQLIRPQGADSIALYWNDTLLAANGGTTHLTACYSSYPVTGCHSWDGNYFGVGIGSLNTVNSWWYASSSYTTIGNFVMTRVPIKASGISGPAQYCPGNILAYTVVPDPLPGADPNSYEWVLTDVSSGITLFDLTGQGVSITINFSLYPSGDKRLKVRGYKNPCGWGPYGPGINGEGILISNYVSPQITNTIRTFSLCSGDLTDIILQATNPSANFIYTATATSPLITGYSGGNKNPIKQTLFNTGPAPDSVIYRVVPYFSTCYGDTALFYVIVIPRPLVSNTTTTFMQCSGATTSINLLSNITGASFSWTASGSSPYLNGFSAGTGPLIAQTLFNSGSNPEAVTYGVSASLNGCSGPVGNFIVTVNPLQLLSLSITVSSNPLCTGTSVLFTAHPVNGGALPVYQWKVDGSNAGANSMTFSYIPLNNDSIWCIMTSNLNCVTGNPVSSNIISMTVFQNPVVSFTLCFDSITSVNAKAFKLKGGIPLGGTYSGPGVNPATGIFTPSSAGNGAKTLTYSYINSKLCSANANHTITVQPSPSFTCGQNFADIRDNRIYPTIKIGTQCWLAGNLNFGTVINGAGAQRDNCIVEKYCYNDLPANCSQFGALYQWDELMRYETTPGIQGLCPPAWHVPAENEWNQLFTFYNGNCFAGSPLKGTGYSGFNALMEGVGFFNETSRFGGFAAIFWSSSSWGSLKARAHGMNTDDYSVSSYPSYRSNAFPVRCIHD